MATKPTYEELEQRIKELDKEALERKRADGTGQESMEKYRMVFETAKDAIFFSDETGKIADVNPAACELLGYTKTELLKRSTREMAVDPRESEAFVKLRAGLMDRIRYETNQRRKDGTLLPVEIIWNFFESDGKRMAIAIARDLTERRRAEETLRKSEAQKQLVVNNLPQAIFQIDNDLKVVWANKVACESSPDPVGQLCYKAFARLEKTCRDCNSIEAMNTGQIATCTTHHLELFGVQGKSYWEKTSVPLSNSEGEVIGAIQMASNVTERKRAEDALTKIRKQLALRTRRLKEANTALKVLLKTTEEDKIEIEERLLHNVKEVIFPYIERLKKARLSGRQIELLSIIESNLKEITSPLVRKLSSTYFRLTPTELRIAKLVKDGKSTLEIAELLNSSDRTIERHRQNIRKKIGIKNTRANLRSMLASL